VASKYLLRAAVRRRREGERPDGRSESLMNGGRGAGLRSWGELRRAAYVSYEDLGGAEWRGR
jgi:hypothetical protein